MDALSVVAAVLGIAVLLGGAVGVFRASMAKSTIDQQATRISSLEGEVAQERRFRERDVAEERRKRELAEERVTSAEVRIGQLQAEVSTLAQLKTGEIALARIETKLNTVLERLPSG